MENKGTPKSLIQAIRNGFDSAITPAQAEEMIRLHILDYLGQSFSAAYMGDWTLTALWERLIEKEKKNE